jgi:hypothetical protein
MSLFFSFVEIPVEIAAMIFEMANEDEVSKKVCVFVCKEWRNLIRLNPFFVTQGYISWMNKVSRQGYVGILKWARSGKNKCRFTCDCFFKAARRGDLETMKWLKEEKCWTYDKVYICAVKGGRVNVLEWLDKNRVCVRTSSCDADCWRLVFDRNYLHIADWMRKHKYSVEYLEEPLCCFAEGKLDYTQWLLDNGKVHVSGHLFYKKWRI